MSLVDTNWLEKNLDKAKIIDCSWHMPQTQRNGFDEYKNNNRFSGKIVTQISFVKIIVQQKNIIKDI